MFIEYTHVLHSHKPRGWVTAPITKRYRGAQVGERLAWPASPRGLRLGRGGQCSPARLTRCHTPEWLYGARLSSPGETV